MRKTKVLQVLCSCMEVDFSAKGKIKTPWKIKGTAGLNWWNTMEPQKGSLSFESTDITSILAENLHEKNNICFVHLHSKRQQIFPPEKTLNILSHGLYKHALYVLLVCLTKQFLLFHALLCWHWCLRFIPHPTMRPFKSTLLHSDTLISIPHWAVNTTFGQTIQCLVHLLKAQIHQWDSHWWRVYLLK